MSKRRDANGRFVKTAGITESVAAVGGAKQAESTSVVGRGAAAKALSPRQIYEQDAIVRTAVMAFAEQPAQCARRLFSRATGDELTGGQTYEWVRRNLTPSFVRDTTSWWVVEGERIALKVFRSGEAHPSRLLVLDPAYLQHAPYHVRNVDLVTEWRYFEPYYVDGRTATLDIPAEHLMFARGFNPNGGVRGLSPLVSCSLEASTNYFINRFNAAFFQNGAHRDLVVRFGKGTSKETAKQWVRDWENKHSIWNGNAFKIAAFVGDDIDVVEPGNNAKEGQFLELRRANNDINAGVLGVPASLMGFYDRTRYDTVDKEEEIYFQYRLLPYCADYSDWVQRQLVDPHFPRGSANSGKRKARFTSKAMRQQYEKAFDEHPESDVIFLLDPDVLPVAARLRGRQLDNAERYRKTQGVSFKAAAEWAGVDRESNEVDDWIVLDNTAQVVHRPGLPNPHEAPQDTPQEAGQAPSEPRSEAEADEPTAEMSDEQKRLKLESLKGFFREYRKLAVGAIAKGVGYQKADVERLLAEHGLADNAAVKVQLARDYLALRAIRKDASPDAGAKVRAAKDHFNSISKAANLRSFITGGEK